MTHADSIPRRPLYLFYGTHSEALQKSRDAVLDLVLPGEGRNENLTEYYPSSLQGKVSLSDLYDEIAGDLATLSLIPDAPKCVVVTNAAELFGAGEGRGSRGGASGESFEGAEGATGGKKGKAAQRTAALLHWLEHELPGTGHTMLLLAYEDEAAQLEVNEKSALFQLALLMGHAQKFRVGEKAFFRIEAALLRRDVGGCLMAIRELWESPKGQTPVYNSVIRCLRYLMQANIARERKATQDAVAQATYFPAAQQFNLFKAHPMVMKKYVATPIYRTLDLIAAYEGMLDVYRAMRPRPDDLYVPDQLGLLEQTLVKLMTSPRVR